MKLIGLYASPFTRRVGMALIHYDLPFEHLPLSTQHSVVQLQAYNPMGRVPALVLDSGEVLIDSSSILKELDRTAESLSSLNPVGDPIATRSREQAMAFLTGALEKFAAVHQERVRRPGSFRWEEWADRCEQQALLALDAVEARWGAARKQAAWLFGDTPSHADFAVALCLSEPAIENKIGQVSARWPHLSAIAIRVRALAAWTRTEPTH